MRSRRSWIPVLGWCAATLTSVALASVAMLPVLRTATPDESSLVSVESLRDAGSSQPTTLPAVPPGPSASPSRSPGPAASPTAPPRSPTRPTAATTTPPSPSRTPPRTTAPMETTTEDGWTVTTDGNGEKSYVRSFRVEGGSTVIRMTEGKVKLVTATPSDGYAVATVQNSPDNLAVYFNQTNHSFIVHAIWWADRNAPFAEVSEVGS